MAAFLLGGTAQQELGKGVSLSCPSAVLQLSRRFAW